MCTPIGGKKFIPALFRVKLHICPFSVSRYMPLPTTQRGIDMTKSCDQLVDAYLLKFLAIFISSLGSSSLSVVTTNELMEIIGNNPAFFVGLSVGSSPALLMYSFFLCGIAKESTVVVSLVSIFVAAILDSYLSIIHGPIGLGGISGIVAGAIACGVYHHCSEDYREQYQFDPEAATLIKRY